MTDFLETEIQDMAKYDLPLTNTAASINRYTRLNLKHDGNGFHAVGTLAVALLVSLHLHMNKLNLQNLGRDLNKWCI